MLLKNMDGDQVKGYFIINYIRKTGSHLLISGRTGTGKTTTMYWLVDAMRSNTKETIVWFDTMKSNECLTLLTMGPCRFIVPKGCTLNINFNGKSINEYEIVEMNDVFNPWANIRGPDLNEDGSIKRSWINIVCLEAYIIDPEVYSIVIGTIFEKLIRLAHQHAIIRPLTIMIDEFHNLAPAAGHELGKVHNKAGKVIQRNVEKLRSLGIRLIGSTQAQSKIRRGVRSSFDWMIIKRGSNFMGSDEPRLWQFNYLWQGLRDLDIVIVNPLRDYSNPLLIKATPECDYYPKGDEIGTMYYDGEIVIDTKNKKREEATA